MISNSYNCIDSTYGSGDLIILATAVIQIHDKFGKPHLARALLDSASQLNFITRSFAQRLNLTSIKTATVVGGIGESHTKVNWWTTATISSQVSEFDTSLPLLLIPSITGGIPELEIDVHDLKVPLEVKLADPRFNIPQKIDLLLGADVFFPIFNGQQIKLGTNCPALLHRKLGWIVSGKCKVKGNSQQIFVSNVVQSHYDIQLEGLVKHFWAFGQVPESRPKLSKEQCECEYHFLQHVQRDTDGRFITILPFKEAPSALGDSKSMAIRHFLTLE